MYYGPYSEEELKKMTKKELLEYVEECQCEIENLDREVSEAWDQVQETEEQRD